MRIPGAQNGEKLNKSFFQDMLRCLYLIKNFDFL